MANVNRYVNTGSTVGGDGTTNAKTGGTRAYVSRASWNTSEATNLVTDTDIHILQCDGDGGTDDPTKLTMSAWTTGASNYITVTNVNSYRLRGVNDWSKLFIMNEDYYREDGLVLEHLSANGNTSTNDSVLLVDAGGGASSDIRFSNLHILGAPREGIVHTGGVGYYDNILIEDCLGNYGFFATYNSSAPNGTVLRHATVVNSGLVEAVGCLNANYLTVKNCYAHDNGSTNGGFSATVQTNYVTCAASDTTGSSGTLDNVAFSTVNFENVTAGLEDLHIKSGSNLNGGGTDISADTNWVSLDFDGVSWETTPSIGVYEFVSSGTTGTLDTTDADDTSTTVGTETFIGTSDTTDTDDTTSSAGEQIFLGTSNTTDNDDTISANGIENFVGTLNETDVDDTTSSAGTETFVGTSDNIDADDTVAASGKSTYAGTLVETDDDDISASAGNVVENPVGTLNETDVDDTTSSAGTETFVGTSNTTDVDDTTSSAGEQIFIGTSDTTDTDDTISAAGIMQPSGTSDTTDTDDTVAATGASTEVNTLNVTDEDDVSASAGTETFVGTSNTTDVDDVSVSAGEQIFIGTSDTTDTDDVSSSAGTETFIGTLNETDNDDTISANGISGEGLSGTLNTTDTDDTTSSVGTEIFVGTLAETDVDDISASAGTSIEDIIALLDITEFDDTSSTSGTSLLPVTGTVNVTDVDDTSSAVGSVLIGESATTDEDDISNTSGYVSPVGTVDATEQNDYLATTTNVEILPSTGLSKCEVTRPLLAKTVEKFYVSFLEMSENVSNILGREVMSFERPNLTFNEYEIHNKGKRWTGSARIDYQPISIVLFDDDQSLVNYAIINQIRKQTYQTTNVKSRFSINAKIYSYGSSVVEELVMGDCYIQSVNYTESNYQDSTINTITVTIIFNSFCYNFPKLELSKSETS